MRVAIETQFARGTATGLGVYASSLAAALRARSDVEVVELRDDSFDLWRFDRRAYWDQLRVRRLAREAHADVIHFTGGTLPWRPPHPCVLTLHDLTWLRAANRGRAYVRWYFGSLQPRLARAADAIVVDTHAARTDVADGLGISPDFITVAGAGVDQRYFTLARKPAQPPFVLTVGTVEERKDLITAVRAIAPMDRIRLVCAGPFTPYADEVRREAARLGAGDRVELLGFVHDDRLLDLYSRAAAFIFPSRYEGFGLPPLQALAAGLPVVSSDIPVLREVLDDGTVYCPPGDARAFSDALAHVLSGGSALDERVARGRDRARTFSWPAVAQTMVSVYARLTSVAEPGRARSR
ncbi:MAG TPA: glycosyltransferase family 1 protein [Candidatus Eremiobacteraceae bacterium]|nr:glycosyltransferase family 1 protein [Candidatus Eremiobacteraceae bacterium]